MNDELKGPPHHPQAEQSIIGALMRDNDAVDRIGDLRAEHFYNPDHALIFKEIVRQIGAGRRADVITVMVEVGVKVREAGRYLNDMLQSTPSAINIKRHVDIVIDRAIKRALLVIGGDLQEWAQSPEDAAQIADRAAARIEAANQRDTSSEPVLMADILTEHVELMQARMEGRIKPVSTGFPDLDKKLGGGMARGTLLVVAGRPAMGKTAFGLGIARNVAEDGVAAFWSMEMPRKQIMDRNVSAIGRLPLDWVMNPSEDDTGEWDRMTHAYKRAREMRLFIDEQTSMNMLQIRAKARTVKRKSGTLDCLVIDQLSFITGAESDNYAYALGEYTRGLVGLAKELDIPVVLLCQLNRKCEDRPNKRPMVSDLASSGNIEQDAATAIFLYRDEVYNPDSPDKGVCEIIIGKARQGETGMVGLAYIGEQTRFESLARPFQARAAAEKTKARSLADRL
jgi:replicative DNA helicase